MNITVKTTITDNRIPGIMATFPGAVSAVVKKSAVFWRKLNNSLPRSRRILSTMLMWNSERTRWRRNLTCDRQQIKWSRNSWRRSTRL